ncbi:MAG TPA: BREX system ATP-binding domain-containing protein [Micromonosporaceae bacterium]
MAVEIIMLGRFAVTVDGAEIPAASWRRRQASALVKLLSLSPRRQRHREQVADALWPEVTADEAGPRLHKAAHYARRILGTDSVVLRNEMVCLFPDAEVAVDADRFAELAEAALAADDTGQAGAAADAYPGRLLPEDLYEPWSTQARDRLELLYLQLLRRAGRWSELVELDPTDTQAQLALMRDLAARGDRRAALRQFERMERALQGELGVVPPEELVALRDALLDAPGGAGAAEDASSPDVLVGRQAETRRLDAVVAEAGSGRGRAVFLSGAAGMGKSFLCRWLRSRAAGQGWRTGTGTASSVEGAWPYAPVLEAVADLCRRHPTLLDGLDDRGRADIERALTGRDLDWSGDGGHQRLYIAVAEVLRLAAAGPGALLTIDSLHEADDASLRLLHFLARSCAGQRLVLVLAHRRQAVSETFEQMRSSLLARGAAVDIPLTPLDSDQATALAVAYRPELSQEEATNIYALSGGLPFAVVEAARASSVDVATAPGAAVLGLLDPQVRGVLEHVAITGMSFDTDEFVALSGSTEDDAYDCLDAALAALVIERTMGGYRFRHPLIREALLERVPPHRQRQLHRICATRLAALDASPARIGHHLLAAGDPSAAVPYVLRAAETEAAVGAYRDAVNLLESIRAVAEGDERRRLLALRADLLAAVGDASAASAYRDAMEVADPEQRRVLKARLARMVVYEGDLDTAAALLKDLELDGGQADATILLARGNLAYFTGDLDAARAVSDQARGLVGGGDTNWQLLDLVGLQGMVAHNRGEWFERLRQELRRTRDNPAVATAVFDSHLCVAEYLLYGPTPYREVLDLAEALRETATRAGAMRAVAFAGALVGEAALLAGDLDRADRELRDSADLHREIGASAGEAHSLQRLAQVRLAQGDRAGATRLLHRALPLARWSHLSMHLLQRIFGTMIAAAERPEDARAVVDRAEASTAEADNCAFCDVMLAVPAAIACADVGDLDDARAQLARAERSAELWAGTAWQAGILEAKAHLAMAESNPSQAQEMLAEAARIFDEAGQPLDAERCRQTAVARAATASAGRTRRSNR